MTPFTIPVRWASDHGPGAPPDRSLVLAVTAHMTGFALCWLQRSPALLYAVPSTSWSLQIAKPESYFSGRALRPVTLAHYLFFLSSFNTPQWCSGVTPSSDSGLLLMVPGIKRRSVCCL